MTTPAQTRTYQRVKRQIESWVYKNSVAVVDYSRWYCGITRHPNIRKAQHRKTIQGEPYYFCAWYGYSFEIASALETHFHNVKGMKDKDIKGGTKADSWYIYVYKKRPTIFDVLFGEP